MPASKAKNTPEGGMNQDLSKSKLPSNVYYRGDDIRLVTDSAGLATGSIQNEPGNELRVKLPDVEAVYEVCITPGVANAQLLISFLVSGGITSYENVHGAAATFTTSTIAQLEVDILANTTLAAEIALGSFAVSNTGDSLIITGLDKPLAVQGTNITVTQLVAPLTGLKCIGSSRINDEVVLFSTNETGTTPDKNTPGQIWKFSIDAVSRIIEDSTNGTLVPSKHLYYNNRLGFSTRNEIGSETVSRFENATTGRVYWTDDYNALRVINLLREDTFSVKPNDLDIIPDVSLSQPIVTEIGSGSIPKGVVVQYFYRLFKKGGIETLFSTGSDLIPLSSFDPNTELYQEYQGVPASGAGDNSVTYTISNLDRNYDIIEHIAVVYSSADNPSIFKFGEDAVPSDGDIVVTHTGSETNIIISAQELNLLNNIVSKAKTITQKDNRLIAGNIESNKFDIDFDARAYRYTATVLGKTAKLYNSENVLETSFTGSNFPTSDTLDAINPFNDEAHPSYEELKYQSDGFTLGGSGPLVSYKLISERIHGDTAIETGTTTNNPFVTVGRSNNTVTSIIDFGTDAKTVDNNGFFENFKSPILSGALKGYARGEVYRFGISFYDKKGNPSFVKWVGDIKIPESYETNNNPGAFNNWSPGTATSSSGSISELQSIGIEFTVDTSSIANDISGYEIVRLKREEFDKTRLGTGALIMLDTTDYSGGKHSLVEGVPDSNIDVDNEVDFHLGKSDVETWYIMDRPSLGLESRGANAIHGVCSIIGPVSQFDVYNNYSRKSGDFIRGTGYYKATLVVNMVDAVSAGAYYRSNSYILPTDFTPKSFLIDEAKKLGFAEHMLVTSFITDAPSSLNDIEIINASYSEESSGVPSGVGDSKQILSLETDSTNRATGISNGGPLSGSFSDPLTDLDWDGIYPGSGTPDFRAITFPTGITQGYTQVGFFIKEMSYGRLLTKQYGGNSYVDRTKSQYMSTGTFVGIDEKNVITSHTNKVFGGDVYVTYYDDEYLNQNWLSDGNRDIFNTDLPNGGANKLSVAMLFPCETSINTELREATHWAKDRDSDNMGAYIRNNYVYNTLYDQDNTAKQIFFAKDSLITDSNESPHRLWASDNKIDGELLDSWRNFKANNFTDVDGVHGPINKAITFRDRLYFYQDAAMGVASVNERVTIPNESGTSIVLGTGAVLDDYAYISTNTGCSHRFGVVPSESALYHFDVRTLKMYQYTGSGANPLSDTKGLNSYFRRNILGNIKTEDRILDDIDPAGIHGVYDVKNNRVIFTFLDYYYKHKTTGDIIAELPVSVIDDGSGDGSGEVSLYDKITGDFTLSYNELVGAYESFYSYKPRLYFKDRHDILSISNLDRGEAYMHEKGSYCEYFGSINADSKLNVILADNPDIIKVFNNLDFDLEITKDGVDVHTDTLSTIQVSNSYQDSGLLTLTPFGNINRKMRKWRVVMPRDAASADDARLRDWFAILELTYNNTDDRRMVLHDILYDYMMTNH